MQNIVLCGSMKVKDKILEVSDVLKSMGYNVLLPEECMRGEKKVIASKLIWIGFVILIMR